MKKLKLFSIICLLFFFVSSCTNSTLTRINKEKDILELKIARKSLDYIAKNEVDSLYSLLSDNFFERTSQEDFDLILEKGKRIINIYEYPNDSLITISRTKANPVSKTVIKDFAFPFRQSNPDSTMTIKVEVIHDKIIRLYLGAGMRVLN